MAKSEATKAKPDKGTGVAAKAKAETAVASKGKSHGEKASASAAKYDEWEVRDAMQTMMRAGEIVKNKHLMGHVRKHAAKHAGDLREQSQRAESLAKRGLISDKAMEGLSKQGGSVKELDKTAGPA